jgi:hypothetical protein
MRFFSDKTAIRIEMDRVADSDPTGRRRGAADDDAPPAVARELDRSEVVGQPILAACLSARTALSLAVLRNRGTLPQ